MKKFYYLYILTNFTNKVLYIGVTHNLQLRVYQHKKKIESGFSAKYNVTKLVYYEEYGSINEAISREKQLKNWHREWKYNLIIEKNPDFKEIPIN